MLGLKIFIIEDATARTLALRTPVQSNRERFGNVPRLAPKLLPSPQQEPAERATLKIVRRGKCG